MENLQQRGLFVASLPNIIPRGQENDKLMMGTDLFPTILNLIGVEPPQDRIIDGKNVLPLLTRECEESPHNHLHLAMGKEVISIVDKDRYKYQIRHKRDNSFFWYLKQGPYLFNINDDPFESYSLLDQEKERAEVLASEIKAMQKSFDTNLRGWKKQNDAG